jgi:hypothetical protein
MSRRDLIKDEFISVLTRLGFSADQLYWSKAGGELLIVLKGRIQAVKVSGNMSKVQRAAVLGRFTGWVEAGVLA